MDERAPLLEAMRRRMTLRQPALDIRQRNIEQRGIRFDLVGNDIVIRGPSICRNTFPHGSEARGRVRCSQAARGLREMPYR